MSIKILDVQYNSRTCRFFKNSFVIVIVFFREIVIVFLLPILLNLIVKSMVTIKAKDKLPDETGSIQKFKRKNYMALEVLQKV